MQEAEALKRYIKCCEERKSVLSTVRNDLYCEEEEIVSEIRKLLTAPETKKKVSHKSKYELQCDLQLEQLRKDVANRTYEDERYERRKVQ